MGSQYGPYIMYFLSQLLQKQRMGQTNASEADETEARDTQKETVTEAEARRQPGTHPAADIFDQDETGPAGTVKRKSRFWKSFVPEARRRRANMDIFNPGKTVRTVLWGFRAASCGQSSRQAAKQGLPFGSQYGAERSYMRNWRNWTIRWRNIFMGIGSRGWTRRPWHCQRCEKIRIRVKRQILTRERANCTGCSTQKWLNNLPECGMMIKVWKSS